MAERRTAQRTSAVPRGATAEGLREGAPREDGLLEEGREAFRRRAWAQAYGRLATAQARGPLPAHDLDLLARAAYLTGREERAEELWERAHLALHEVGAVGPAARCAFWLGLTLARHGHHERAGGWFGRATRLLEDAGGDYVERGYLLVPAGLRAMAAGDHAAARAAFAEAARIADRFGDPDLAALGRLGRGQALIADGDVVEGRVLLDEAMVAVTADEVSPITAGIVYCAVIIACRDTFDIHRAAEWTTALSRWCAAQPDLRPYRGQCLVHRSEIMQLHGEWTDALAEAQQACAHMDTPAGDPAVGMAHYQRAELLRLRGAFARAEEAYREADRWGHSRSQGSPSCGWPRAAPKTPWRPSTGSRPRPSTTWCDAPASSPRTRRSPSRRATPAPPATPPPSSPGRPTAWRRRTCARSRPAPAAPSCSPKERWRGPGRRCAMPGRHGRSWRSRTRRRGCVC
ncbi:hypothetical protein [Streptomyces pini]|uniref:hypothetical protein n=1 Tax=Streptomyces pini TaxID=1520580 RepID=UPI001FE3F36B|nr:hypothetical protein [Streptomyces pini]